jgi:uncharacterized repeat protein (TIGR01451 family)
MSRFSIVIVAGLVAIGCIVAIVPAQESLPQAEFTVSDSGPPADPTYSSAEPAFLPAALPEADPMPASPPPAEFAAAPQQFTPPPQAPAALFAAVAADEPTPASGDEGPLRSVLRQDRTYSNAESQSAPPGVLPRPGGAAVPSSRRTLAAPPASLPRPAATTPPTAVAARPAPRSIQDLTVSGRSPALRVDLAGPQAVTAGKPATYTISLANESDSPAEDVIVRLALPGSVSVTGSQPSSGDASIQPDSQGAARLVWNIPRVPARSHEQLRLSLVTSEGDAAELGLEWTCRPMATKASISVKQPKLEMSLAGPADMTFGDVKTFTLSVSNPGTGDAERVIVSVASGGAPPQQIEVGSIPAGYKKELAIEVVASQPGEMELRAAATGEGGLTAETSGKIVVRKAEVQLSVQGPPLKFAGSEAVYSVIVANSGTAAADNVQLALALPPGAKFAGGIDGAAVSGGHLKWKVTSLPAGAERTCDVRLVLASPGINRLVVQAQAGSGGAITAQTETQVEAVADLKLVVNDPSGPLPVDDDAIYEVNIVNRGSQAAQRVRIVMQFASGVEPVSFEGCQARIVPGQVVCQPLNQLGAGEQVTLRVKAKAQQAGTHQFRVEVTAADGESRLVSEGTTRFFADSGSLGSTASRPALLPTPATSGTIQR